MTNIWWWGSLGHYKAAFRKRVLFWSCSEQMHVAPRPFKALFACEQSVAAGSSVVLVLWKKAPTQSGVSENRGVTEISANGCFDLHLLGEQLLCIVTLSKSCSGYLSIAISKHTAYDGCAGERSEQRLWLLKAASTVYYEEPLIPDGINRGVSRLLTA